MDVADKDLFSKIESLPEPARSEFMEFFGPTKLSQAEVEDLEHAISTSIALKNRKLTSKTTGSN